PPSGGSLNSALAIDHLLVVAGSAGPHRQRRDAVIRPAGANGRGQSRDDGHATSCRQKNMPPPGWKYPSHRLTAGIASGPPSSRKDFIVDPIQGGSRGCG